MFKVRAELMTGQLIYSGKSIPRSMDVVEAYGEPAVVHVEGQRTSYWSKDRGWHF